jgi:hypothetical protein
MPAPLVPVPTFLRDWPAADQRQQLLEAPRPERLSLCARLLGVTEPALLAELARRAGLALAADLKPDAAAVPLLPARLVHEFQTMPILSPAGQPAADAIHLATLWPPDAEMTDWIGTFTSRPLRWHLAPPRSRPSVDRRELRRRVRQP